MKYAMLHSSQFVKEWMNDSSIMHLHILIFKVVTTIVERIILTFWSVSQTKFCIQKTYIAK